jgi:hypothetical protein
VMMMSEEQKKLADELASEWGERTRAVLRPLSALIGEAIRKQDLLAAGFIVECASGVLTEACAIAREMQERRGRGPTDFIQ